MKKNYEIGNYIEYRDKYILVDNYFKENEICNFGYIYIEQVMGSKDKNSIGMWKIKNKKS